MEKKPDLQQRLLEGIKQKLPKGEKLAQVMMDTLHLSQDAVYRRIRGEVPLTIFETKTLCETFNISFDDYGTFRKGQVTFTYNSLTSIEMNFEAYLTGLRDGMRQIKNAENPELMMSINDTPIFQLFNLPHLTRFKFFFWAKTYLKIPAYVNEKFKREKIDKRVLQIGIEAHNLYNSIPTHEVYSHETLRGTLRQIQYYFDADLFEEPAYALELVDNLQQLVDHMKVQAELGRKFARGNEPVTSGNEFHMYFNETFISDNTYLIKWKDGKAVYFTHNIMNYLLTFDPVYVGEAEFMLDNLFANSSPISVVNVKERSRFFSGLERTIATFRKHIEANLEM
ncbi:MAG: hypothetical protein IPM77_07835 [Crocinitomicaceae bacterium]|nr:hypothetical protein [Crocinitomicaceae bacterium]